MARRPFPKVSIHLDIGLHGLDLLHGLYLDIHLLMSL
jgi:hypothetical protein